MEKLFCAAAATALTLLTVPAFADAGHVHAIGQPGDAKKVSRTIEMTMSDDMRFTPASIRIKRGETIRFVIKNTGEIKHELVLGRSKDLEEHAALMQKHPEMEHDDPNAVAVEPGQTGELVWHFTRPGNLKFACLVPGHYGAGMVGTVRVQ